MVSKLAVLLLSLLLIAGVFTGCEKHMNHGKNHDTHNMHEQLEINYPALYVVNGQSNNLSVIQLGDLNVTETIGLNGGTFPHHVYLSPDKSKLAVAITGTDFSGGHAGHSSSIPGLKIQIIDTYTGALEKEIPLNKLSHNAVFNKDGSELWVGQLDSIQSEIKIYRTTDWTLKNTIKVGKGLSEITFSADGNTVYACNTGESTVHIIDPVQKIFKGKVAVGVDPVGAWTASNGNAYVDNENSQTVSEISGISNAVIRTITLGFKPGYVAYASNGELWVSDATNGRVVYYTLAGNEWVIAGSIATGADAHAIVFTADYKRAFVTNQGSNTVSVIDMDSHTELKTITVGAKPNGMAIKM